MGFGGKGPDEEAKAAEESRLVQDRAGRKKKVLRNLAVILQLA